MPLLSPGNTEFRESVTRGMFHFKSRRLRKLLAALAAFQNDSSGAKLAALAKRLRRWKEENPNELRARGTRVAALEQEIKAMADRMGGEVAREAERDEPVGLHEADDSEADVGPFANGLRRKFAVWTEIEITDKPTGVPGKYNFTEGNSFSEGDRNSALAMLGVEHNPEQNPKYWLALGKLVQTEKLGKYYGRCFSCAAAVIYSLVMDEEYDGLMIEHIGAVRYDHHLVLVGRANANGTDGTGLNGKQAAWGDAVVIDVWQGNLAGDFEYVFLPKDSEYVHGEEQRWFCAFPPEKRGEHRAYAQSVKQLRTAPLLARVLAQRGDPSTGAEGKSIKNPAYQRWLDGGKKGLKPPQWIPA
jgi:hypothetical protein